RHTRWPRDWSSDVCSSDLAWRWNLDYVVDPRGNSMTLFYQREGNWYGAYNNSIVYWETRGGYLQRIEYGTKAGEEADGAPAKVLFDVDVRCLQGGNCEGHPEYWPDTPWDQWCGSTTNCSHLQSPVFWTEWRLRSVTTQIWD